MGVGQIISDTFGTVKSRFGQMLGLWAIYFAIMMALLIVLTVAMGALGVAGFAAMESNPLAVGGGFLVFLVLFYLAYLFVAMAQYASLILMASPMERPTVSTALSAGWRAAPALLLLIVVLIVGYIAAALVFSLVAAAFSAMGETAGLVLSLLLVPVLVWLGCRLSPIFAVVAVDGVRNPFTAIAHSWRLTRGHALTIFLASLVLILILVVVCGIALLPSFGLLGSMADPAGLAGADAVGSAMGGIALLMLGLLVVSILFNLAYCAFLAVLHGSLTTAGGEGAAEVFA